MSSSTTTPNAAANPAAALAASATVSLKSLFAKLTIDELTQVVNAASPALDSLSTGDGSTPALMGAWLQLQGAFIGNASIFQKIGVNDLATAILAEMNAALATAQATAAASTASGATGTAGA